MTFGKADQTIWYNPAERPTLFCTKPQSKTTATTPQQKTPAKKPQQKTPETAPQQDFELENEEKDLRKEKTNRKRTKIKRPRNRKNKEIKIMAINVRGAKGKITSLQTLLQAEDIQIALITETLFKADETYNIKGYKWIGKNRTAKAGGGIGILISNKIANKVTEVTNIEDPEELETSWLKLDTRPTPIYIGVFYGPQESDNRERTTKIYQYVSTQIKQLQKRGEIILGGDFNAKLQINTPNGKQEE